MRRLLAAVALAGLMPVVSSYPPSSASGATPTCEGKRATIVGPNQGDRIQGTSGPDVIVTAGAAGADGGDGDDLICVTDTAAPATFAGGGGDDVIDTTAATSYTTVKLDLGSDTLVGGDLGELVYDHDDGTDHIATGGGDDTVYVERVRLGVTGTPTINLGGGDDSLYLQDLNPGDPVIQGGSGENLIDFANGSEPHKSWIVDDRTGTATDNGVVKARWTGFTDFRLDEVDVARLSFIGSAANERVDVESQQFDDRPAGNPVSVDSGAGDDTIIVAEADLGHNYHLDGGPGRDTLAVEGGKNLKVDLAPGTIVNGGVSQGHVVAVENVSVAFVTGITLLGNKAANTFRVGGHTCDIRLDGRGGNDHLSTAFSCGTPVLHGGPGDDVLVGGSGSDRLYGDAGRDRANGRTGHDLCVAEVRIACEVS